MIVNHQTGIVNLKAIGNSNSEVQDLYEKLNDLIPNDGRIKNPIKNKNLEALRKASQVYFQLWCNGFIHDTGTARNVLGLKVSTYKLPPNCTVMYIDRIYVDIENKMTEIIKKAAIEQGLL